MEQERTCCTHVVSRPTFLRMPHPVLSHVELWTLHDSTYTVSKLYNQPFPLPPPCCPHPLYIPSPTPLHFPPPPSLPLFPLPPSSNDSPSRYRDLGCSTRHSIVYWWQQHSHYSRRVLLPLHCVHISCKHSWDGVISRLVRQGWWRICQGKSYIRVYIPSMYYRYLWGGTVRVYIYKCTCTHAD